MPGAVSIRKHPAASWKLPFTAAELSRLLEAMLDEAGCGETAVELALLDDAAMERLNEKSAGCAGPTNILAFTAPAERRPADAPHPAGTSRSPQPDAFADPPEAAGDAGAAGSLHAVRLPPAVGEEKNRPCLGWLALSADTLLRECFLYGQEAEEHCIRLLAHGLAHLTGLDHGPAMDHLTGGLEAAATAALPCQTSSFLDRKTRNG